MFMFGEMEMVEKLVWEMVERNLCQEVVCVRKKKFECARAKAAAKRG